MSSSILIVSAPNEGGRSSFDMIHTLGLRTGQCRAYKLDMPLFRIGNLDSLISLADTLEREGNIVENTVNRLLNQYKDLAPEQKEAPYVAVIDDRDVDAIEYLTNFDWDEAKFASTESLPEILSLIKAQTDRMDGELKVRSAEYTATKQALATIERNTRANLLTRNLSSVITADDVVHSEHMRTVFVVVPAFAEVEFLDKYEGLAQFVVPRSARKISTENEYVLFGVTLLSKSLDDFKKKCRENRFTVRDFNYEADAAHRNELEHDNLVAQQATQHEAFARWTETAFAESFIAFVHLKLVRVFVESVLRYGLPIDFTATVVIPVGNEKRLRTSLRSLFGHLSGAWATAGGDEDIPSVPGVYVDKEIYPYVSVTLQLPKLSS